MILSGTPNETVTVPNVSPAETAEVANLFAVDETVGDKNGQRLTVRVDLDEWRVYHPNMKWRSEGTDGSATPELRRMRDATLIAMRVNPEARTPSGGKYIKIDVEVSVRTPDGYTYWEGTMRTGKDRTPEETNIVRLVPRGSRKSA